MKRTLVPLAVLTAVTLAGDLACRSFARGGNPERLLGQAAENLAHLPRQIGPWRAAKTAPLSDNVLEMLDCRAHESCTFIDDKTGEEVGLTLLAGTAGPMVAHTPEVCYESSSFEIAEATQSESIRGTGDRADTFDRVTFRSNSVGGERQRVYYAWRKFDGSWQAPARPRLALGSQPMLYKLQVASRAPSEGDDTPDSDAARRFLLDLLPILDNTLVPK